MWWASMGIPAFDFCITGAGNKAKGSDIHDPIAEQSKRLTCNQSSLAANSVPEAPLLKGGGHRWHIEKTMVVGV